MNCTLGDFETLLVRGQEHNRIHKVISYLHTNRMQELRKRATGR